MATPITNLEVKASKIKKSKYVARPQPYIDRLFKAGSFPLAHGRLLVHILDYFKLRALTQRHLPQLGSFVTCDAADCLYLNLLGMLTGEYNGLVKLGEYGRNLDLPHIFDSNELTIDSFNRQANRLIERINSYDPRAFAAAVASAIIPTTEDGWNALSNELLDELDRADSALSQAKAAAVAQWTKWKTSEHAADEIAPTDPTELPNSLSWLTITPQALGQVLPFLKTITLEIIREPGGGNAENRYNFNLSCIGTASNCALAA